MDEKLSKTAPDGSQRGNPRQEKAPGDAGANVTDEPRGSRLAGLRSFFTKFSRANVDAEEAGKAAADDSKSPAFGDRDHGGRRDRDRRDNNRRDAEKPDATKFSPTSAAAIKSDSAKSDATKTDGKKSTNAEAPTPASASDSGQQFGREVRIGLAIVSILLLIFGYVFVKKISGDGKSVRIALPGEEPKIVEAPSETNDNPSPATESSAKVPTVVSGDAPAAAQRHAPDSGSGIDTHLAHDDVHSGRTYDSDVRRDSFLPKPDRAAASDEPGPAGDRRHAYDKDDIASATPNSGGIVAREERADQDDIPSMRDTAASTHADDAQSPAHAPAHAPEKDAVAQEAPAHPTAVKDAVKDIEPHASSSDVSDEIAAAIGEKYAAGKYGKSATENETADAASRKSPAVAADARANDTHASDSVAEREAPTTGAAKSVTQVQRDETARDEAPAYAADAPRAIQARAGAGNSATNRDEAAVQERATARDADRAAQQDIADSREIAKPRETAVAEQPAPRDEIRQPAPTREAPARDLAQVDRHPNQRLADDQESVQPGERPIAERSNPAASTGDSARSTPANDRSIARSSPASGAASEASSDRDAQPRNAGAGKPADDRPIEKSTAARDTSNEATGDETTSDETVNEQQPPARTRLYTVREGETIYDIARHELGRVARWKEIVALNQESIGEDIEAIEPGLRIRLPDEHRGASVARGLGELPWR